VRFRLSGGQGTLHQAEAVGSNIGNDARGTSHPRAVFGSCLHAGAAGNGGTGVCVLQGVEDLIAAVFLRLAGFIIGLVIEIGPEIAGDVLEIWRSKTPADEERLVGLRRWNERVLSYLRVPAAQRG